MRSKANVFSILFACEGVREIKGLFSLWRELRRALNRPDVGAVVTKPSAAFPEYSVPMLVLAAMKGVLTERDLNKAIDRLYQNKDRTNFRVLVLDDRLGFHAIRESWSFYLRFMDGDTELRLDDLISSIKANGGSARARRRLSYLILGQSYREKSWGFALEFLSSLGKSELCAIQKPFLYGFIVGLINDGLVDEARRLLQRLKPGLDNHGKLYFSVPMWRCFSPAEPPPTNEMLVRKLHAAFPSRGPDWDWFCRAYCEKIKQAGRDFTDVRVNTARRDELRGIILDALVNRRPFSLHRLGDGGVYRFPLPTVAGDFSGRLPGDDHYRERSWWRRELPREKGDRFAQLVIEALQKADAIGVISAHRLIRDANGGRMVETRTGRALLAHVEALGTLIPLHDKIVTEDRVHTLIYSPQFLSALTAQAKQIVVVGGLPPERMGLEGAKFIALTPEQDKGMPSVDGARSIVDSFDELHQDVKNVCGPGTLAIISGGYVGKALVHAAKDAGAVALDFGSFADLLAGHHTRSPADAVVDLEHK